MMQNQVIAIELPTGDNVHATVCPECAKRKFPDQAGADKLVTLPKGISHCNACGASLVNANSDGDSDTPYPPDPDRHEPTEFYM